jgi:phage terminase large subunit
MEANPGARGLIVRKTQVSMTSTALVTWREFVIKEQLEAGSIRYYGGSREEPPQYRYSNGSAVLLGGMDKPTKIMSSEYDLIYIQEATELSITDWEHITTRLRHGSMGLQQVLADTNPDADTHWLWKRVTEGATKAVKAEHTDNPVYFGPDGAPTPAGAAYMARLERLTGLRRSRLLHGLWVAAEGVIYEGWDPGVHLIERFTPPADWIRWWAIDFGYTNPFVLQRWAEDPDGRLYLYAERYMTHVIVEDHAKAVLAEVAPDGEWREPRPRGVICDHDSEDRETFTRHAHLRTIPARKAVTPGIEAVQSRMKRQEDGRPRIFVMRDARTHAPDPDLVEAARPTCTAEEIPSYVWAQPLPGRPPKEEPVKDDDHGCDGMRYMVAHRDIVKRPRVRFM